MQAKVLDLFQELQQEKGFACLFISHDLAVVEILARRIAVMHHGQLVELGTREQILNDPQQDYTKRLIAAVPVPDPDEQRRRRHRARRDPGRRDRPRRPGRHATASFADLTEAQARERAKEAQAQQGPGMNLGGV